MEKKIKYPIWVMLLFILFSGCGDDFSDSTSSSLSPTVTVPRALPVPMDAICDLSLFGESLGDDAHTTNTGDIDADGYTDLIVGAQAYDSNHGRAYLYYGGPNGLTAIPSIVFEGEPDSHLGWSIGVGDVDDDGYDDVILSGAGYDSNRGRAYLYWGDNRMKMDAVADLVFEGESSTDRFSVSWDDIVVEDIDADGYADIVIPAATYGPSEGRAYLYWGNTKARMDVKADLVLAPPDEGGWFGGGLDCGDIDHDGYKDVVIGARTYGPNDCGRAYLYWGGTQNAMDSDCDLVFEAETTNKDGFGANVGIGDIDNDGFEDILVGANTFNNVQGRAYLFWGTARAQMDTNCDLKFTGEPGRGGFAELCICDGDVNGDGYADILISARQYDNFRGRAYLYLGDTKEEMDARAELILTGENERDWFGDPPGGSFGDFNNDGYDDLAIGARMWQSNTEQGRIYVYHGGPTFLASDAVEERDVGLASSLHRAASDGDVDLIESLISRGKDVDSLDEARRTPLHSAALQGRRKVVEVLIVNGAAVNVKDRWGYAPVDVVGSQNHQDIVKLLLKHGATISSLHVAASVGDMNKVKTFIQEGIDINARDLGGYTPLHLAVQSGQTDIVEFLITKGADVKAKDRRNKTPLHTAASNGHREAAELLIANGAEVEAKRRGDWTPLFDAVDGGHKEVAKLLLNRGVDVNSKDNSPYTPLSYAIWNEDKDMIKLLVSKGADVNFTGKDDWTYLHYVAENDDRELARLLVAHGAKLNVRDNIKRTALHIALSRGRQDMAEFLISKGAKDPELHLAACLGNLERVKSLVETGVDIDTTDEAGFTSLYWAISVGREEVAEFLIDKGADIGVEINSNRSLLHQAAQWGSARLVKLLISKGTDVNARVRSDLTPLHSAAERGHKNIVELLIANGADVKAKGKSGNTPLHSAARAGRAKVVEVLLAHGADVNAKDKEGHSPLWHAQDRRRSEVAELLLKHGAKE